MSTASLIVKPNISNMHAEETPPNTPTQSCSRPTVMLELTQDVVDKLQLHVTSKNVIEGSSEVQINEIPASEDHKSKEEEKTRASRVEYKSVDEVYVIFARNSDPADQNYF